MRLIDADAYEKKLVNIAKHFAKSDAQKLLIGRIMFCLDQMSTIDVEPNQMPAIDAEPIKRGQWEISQSPDHYMMLTCSECGCIVHTNFEPNYCRECGAKMNGGNE